MRTAHRRAATTTLAAAAAAPQNYVDVANAAGFARDDYVVRRRRRAGLEEYVRIQFVDGNRLWFSSPTQHATTRRAPSAAHAAGATVREVDADAKLADGVDYSLDAAPGQITELVEFGAGTAVLASYTTDFVMPATYPLRSTTRPTSARPPASGRGKPLVDGTYTARHLELARR